MATYEFDIDEEAVNLTNLVTETTTVYNLFARVKKERPSGHPVLQVVTTNEEDFRSLKKWYGTYYDTGEPLYFYEVP